MKQSALAIVILSLFTSLAAEAQQASRGGSGLPYSSFSVAYIKSDIDDIDDDMSGFGISALLEPTSSFLIGVDYSKLETDKQYPLGPYTDKFTIESRSVSIGGYLPVANKIDLLALFSFINGEGKLAGFTEDVNGNAQQFGIRAAPVPQVGLMLLANRSDIEDETDTSFSFGIEFFPIRAISLALLLENKDDGDTMTTSASFYF